MFHTAEAVALLNSTKGCLWPHRCPAQRTSCTGSSRTPCGQGCAPLCWEGPPADLTMARCAYNFVSVEKERDAEPMCAPLVSRT